MTTNNTSISRRLQFCLGHRVYGHESKCANFHGHNYVLYIHAKPDIGLDDIGRVIDFSVLKEKVGGWIDEHWDHQMVLWQKDPKRQSFLTGDMSDQPLYTLPTNPTAENLAAHLLHDICPILFKNDPVTVYKIVLWETENCNATVEI